MEFCSRSFGDLFQQVLKNSPDVRSGRTRCIDRNNTSAGIEQHETRDAADIVVTGHLLLTFGSHDKLRPFSIFLSQLVHPVLPVLIYGNAYAPDVGIRAEFPVKLCQIRNFLAARAAP